MNRGMTNKQTKAADRTEVKTIMETANWTFDQIKIFIESYIVVASREGKMETCTV